MGFIEKDTPCCYNCLFWMSVGNNMGECGKQYRKKDWEVMGGVSIRSTGMCAETQANYGCDLFVHRTTGELMPSGPIQRPQLEHPCTSGFMMDEKYVVKWTQS